LSHAYSLPPWVGLTLLVIVCASAFWKGGREEQIAAGAVLLSVVVTVVLRDPRWVGLQRGAFVADVLLLLALGALALRTARYWPMAAAAFQLLCVLTHVARMIDPGVRGWAYATGQVIFTQWVLITIGVGVLNTWRAERQVARTAVAAIAPGATRR